MFLGHAASIKSSPFADNNERLTAVVNEESGGAVAHTVIPHHVHLICGIEQQAGWRWLQLSYKQDDQLISPVVLSGSRTLGLPPSDCGAPPPHTKSARKTSSRYFEFNVRLFEKEREWKENTSPPKFIVAASLRDLSKRGPFAHYRRVLGSAAGCAAATRHRAKNQRRCELIFLPDSS